MAYNYGGDIGEGIALSAKGDMFQGLIAHKMALDEYDKKAKAARGVKSAQDWEKYVNDVKPEKVHALDYEQAQKDYAEKFIAPASELIKKYGDTWENTAEAAKLKSEAKFTMDMYATRKTKLDEDEKTIEKAMQGGTATPEMVKAYESYRKGDKKGLLSIQDPYGTIGTTTDNDGRVLPIVNVIPKFNWPDIMEKEYAKPNFQMQQSYVHDRAIKTGDKETQRYIATYGIPRTKDDAAAMAQKLDYPAPLTSSQSLLEGFANDPMHFNSLEQYVRDRIDADPDYSKRYHAMSQQDKSSEVAKLALDKSAPFMGVKLKEEKLSNTPKSSGYNKATGAAAGDRFASEKNAEGGGVISPISGTEKLPQVHVEADYALKGDAKDASGASIDKSWDKSADVSYQSWKTLINPATGKKQMFFVVNKAPSATGSETDIGAADKSGVKTNESTKVLSADQTWLIPAHLDQQKKFFTYTANKKGTNPHKESFLDDLKKMDDFNSKVENKKDAGVETFVVEGVTHNIPKDKVASFKKAKGL